MYIVYIQRQQEVYGIVSIILCVSATWFLDGSILAELIRKESMGVP